MKKSKQCIKCESLRVVWYATPGDPVPTDTVTYMCVDCGYFETYRRFPEDLLADIEGDERYKDRLGWVNPQSGEQGPYR